MHGVQHKPAQGTKRVPLLQHQAEEEEEGACEAKTKSNSQQ